MRYIYVCTLVSLLAACGHAALPPETELQTLYVLPGGTYQVSAAAGKDLAAAIRQLGPPTHTRVNVSACSAAQSADVVNAVRALEKSGYENVGFVVADPSQQPACGR